MLTYESTNLFLDVSYTWTVREIMEIFHYAQCREPIFFSILIWNGNQKFWNKVPSFLSSHKKFFNQIGLNFLLDTWIKAVEICSKRKKISDNSIFEVLKKENFMFLECISFFSFFFLKKTYFVQFTFIYKIICRR